MALPQGSSLDSLKPRLLVLNDDPTLIQSLSRVLQPTLSDLTLASASSASRALLLFDTSAYHAVISSLDLMFVDGRSFLTRSRAMQPPLPFLLTLRPRERKLAQDWLELGVYDFNFSPLDPPQALESVQAALALSDLHAHIVYKKQALVQLRQRREGYLLNNANKPLGQQVDILLNSSITRIEDSNAALQYTMERIETSLKALQRACHDNELHARERALNRLKARLSR